MTNPAHIVETALLLLAAYLLGCLVGYGARRFTYRAVDANPPLTITPPISLDDLKKIKGIGPKIESSLHTLGIVRLDQIAGWTDADIERIDAQLPLRGRIRRDRWVEQARALVGRA